MTYEVLGWSKKGGVPTTTVRMEVHGADPLIFWAPPIDMAMTLTLSEEKTGYLNYCVTGYHDGFPNYELYLERQLVWSFDAAWAQGAELFTVNPLVDNPLVWEFTTSGTIPAGGPLTIVCDGHNIDPPIPTAPSDTGGTGDTGIGDPTPDTGLPQNPWPDLLDTGAP